MGHYVGEFHFVPVARPSHWLLNLDTLKVGSVPDMTATRQAIVDSGSSLITGPWSDVEAVADMIGATYIMGSYAVECSADVPSIAFTLGGRDFAMTKGDLVVTERAGWCILGLDVISDDAPFWILGDLFMRKYYVQFDWGNQRVGFALSTP